MLHLVKMFGCSILSTTLMVALFVDDDCSVIKSNKMAKFGV